SAGIVIDRRRWHQTIVVFGKAQRLHEHGLSALRAARHVRTQDGLVVEPLRDVFGNERHDVSSAPGKVFLQIRCVGRPYAIEAGTAVVPAIGGHGRVSALERWRAQFTVDGATESAARDEEELAIPVSPQRKPQLELVLWCDKAGDRAILLDPAGAAVATTETTH